MKRPRLTHCIFACAMLSIPFAMVSSALGQQTTADVLADPTVDLKVPEERAKAVAKIKAIEEARATKTHAKAKALGLKIRIEKPDGGTRELVDFENGKPLYIETKNLNAAISTNVAPLHSSPYMLDGSGLTVGVWDDGAVRNTHQEFATGSRVTLKDAGSPTFHHTHVAGTIAAAGVSASRKGMAPNVRIDSYNWSGDESEMTSRAATGPNQFADKIYISNHSYGYARGWDGNEWNGDGTTQTAADYAFGQYNFNSRNLDSIHYNAPYYISFWAAGNDGNDNPSKGSSVIIGGSTVSYDPLIHPAGDKVYRGGFEMIADQSIGKNVIAIGAVNDAVNSGVRDPSKATPTSFTSTGPTDDGRIKPDLVANGASLDSTKNNANNAYATASGTSMASPNAAGSAVLLVDQYKRLFNSAMRSSTLKGLLIHTATDRGNPGPDYKYGWGLINAKSAVDLIIDHHANPVKTRIIEDQVSTTITTRIHSFQWDGSSPLRATACWTDPAGISTYAHDSRDPTLVNDLNLKLVAPNGAEYFPYVMPFVGTWTVASMNLNATTGINSTDNVEMVNIQSPGQAGTWQAVISYTGVLTNDAQAYGLILSGTANTPNTVIVNTPNGGENFYTGSSYPLSWASNVAGNVSIELLKGGVFHSVLSANEPNDGSFTWVVPTALPLASDYAIRISSVSNPSYTDTSDATFTVAANPWATALDTAGILWNSSSSKPWFYQTTTKYDGEDAAQSGAIGNSASTSLEGTIQGPATMTFWWKVSSEASFDFLRFSLNGVEQTAPLTRISGNIDWVQKTVNIPSGSHLVSWSYTKDGSATSGSDAGWVDQVVVTPINEVALSSATYQVSENVGSATITVNRTFGTNGAISVDYSTANVTALSGSDYTTTSGTLNWADGDLAPKSFNVPITNDSIHEDFLETLTITLSNNVGCILGEINSATLTIQDDDNNVPVVDAGVDQTVVIEGSVPLPWTPADLTSVSAWYDAADASTITLNGGAVTQWNDKSVNGRNVSQATSGQRPSFASQTVSFDGADDILMRTGAFMYANGSVDIYLVGAISGTVADKRLLAESSSSSNNPLYCPFQNRSGTDFTMMSGFIRDDGNTARFANSNSLSATGAFNLSTRKLYQVRDNGTSLAGRVNGGTATTASYTRGATTLTSFGIGGIPPRPSSGTGSAWMRADVNEIIIVPSLLSDSDRQKLEGYLAHKWGTTTSLPDAHPYKNEAPLQGNLPAATATLSGTASDADNDPMTFSWSVISQPDDSEVTFADDNALNTTASFTVEGVYLLSLTASDGRVAISDEVEITVQTPYAAWAAGFPTMDLSNPAGDNDGDNLTNLQEYAFGTDPTASTGGSISYTPGGTVTTPGTPVALNLATGEGVDYRAVFGRRENHEALGLTYTVQFTADMTNWVDSTADPVVLTGTPSAGDIEAVSVPYPFFIEVDGGYMKPTFFRVGVSGN